MFPLLYKSTSTIISEHNFKILGRLTLCYSCKITEERNGNYTLTATISADDRCAQIIQTQYFIKAKPNPFDPPQFFMIYKLAYKDNNKIEIKARHIKHCLYNNVVSTSGDIGSSPDVTPNDFWNDYIKGYTVLENHFAFSSNISSKKQMSLGFNIPCTIGELLSDKEGSILDVYGGEYKYNNFSVSLMGNRGKSSGYCLRWGQNISSREQTITSMDIASHIVAVAEVFDEYSGKSYYLTGDAFPLTSTSSKVQSLHLLDVSEEASKNQEYWTINSNTGKNIDLIRGQLNVRATASRQAVAKNNGKAIANIKVDFRAELDEMKYIGLCDSVYVDINGEKLISKIIKTEYDALLERWDKLELGTPKSRLSDYIIK